MISIKPEWVAKILNGEKTIEIRKAMPKCKFPCKVYIYETKGTVLIGEHFERSKSKDNFFAGGKAKYIVKKDYYYGKGKVVAEFTLDKIDDFQILPDGYCYTDMEMCQKSCMIYDQIEKYIGKNKKGYAWYINNLKIYDKPKELSQFQKDLDCDDYPCNKNYDCPHHYYDISEGCWACGIDFDGTHCIFKQLKRPPQSWCYVEEIK